METPTQIDPPVALHQLVRLVWGRTTPTENGYFWYREHVQHRAVIYNVAACARCGFAQKWDGTTKDVKFMTGWWAGPIPKPEPPSLPNDERMHLYQRGRTSITV